MKPGLMDWLRKSPGTPPGGLPWRGPQEPAHYEEVQPRAEVAARFVDRGELQRGSSPSLRCAYDRSLLRHVAMKVLDPETARFPEAARAFLEEAQLGGQLDHPNIPPLYELGADEGGTQYLISRLVQGQTLRQLMPRSAPERLAPERLEELLDVVMKVCDAVSYAHVRGVVHSDIQPDNILVGSCGEVYLVNWGRARLLGAPATTPMPANLIVSRTPAYLAPEQALGDTVDDRTDIFGLGTLLYHLLTGRAPYQSALESEALVYASDCQYPSPEALVTDVVLPAGLCKIAARAMARRREDRFPSVAALKREIERFLRGGLHLPQRRFARGTRILVEGERGDTAYIVLKGTCEVWKRTTDGGRRVVGRIGPGSVFGEVALVANDLRSATVEAVDDVVAVEVTRAQLEDDLGADSWMGTLVRTLVTRFRALEERTHAIEHATGVGEVEILRR